MNSRTSGVDLGGDPQLSASNGRVFMLARGNDLVFEVDASCGTPKARFSVNDDAYAVRGNANPHDVAAAKDGTLFVALYNVPRIAFVKNGAVEGSLDLSAYDPDGNPEAESVRIVDVAGAQKAFVTLERLTRRGLNLRSERPSSMLRIDVATRKVEATIELAGRNPFNPMAEWNGLLFLAEPGNFDANDEPLAGIERFDTGTSTTQLFIAERNLGGSVAEVAVEDGCGAAIVAGSEPTINPTSLVAFDARTGEVFGSARAPLFGPTPGFDLRGLAFRNGALYVGDRRREGGGYTVHIFDHEAGTCKLHDTGRTLLLPLPPVAMRAAR
jgi:hypothetical protein